MVFATFRSGVNIYQVVYERSMVILADVLTVLLRYFLISCGYLIIIINYQVPEIMVDIFELLGIFDKPPKT